jgi:hypothetical protein
MTAPTPACTASAKGPEVELGGGGGVSKGWRRAVSKGGEGEGKKEKGAVGDGREARGW